MNNLKVVFMGTPEFAVPVLEMLIKKTNVVMVVCQPDSYQGRHHDLILPPTKKVANQNNILVFQPVKIRDDFAKIMEVKPDIIITCAYGQIIPQALLELPPLGCINVHASLLPKLRGGAPINHAIMDGLTKTGITIMYMAEHMDDGDIISQREYLIQESDTYGTLVTKLSQMGTELLAETLPRILDGTNTRIKQDSAAVTFAYTIKRAEEHLSLFKIGSEIDHIVRGLNPEPLANIIINDVEVKIIEGYFVKGSSKVNTINDLKNDAIGLGCADGIYYATKIKVAGKKAMLVKDYLNGIDKNKLKNAIIK
jgi:methionyl-tRNA formyltransferase